MVIAIIVVAVVMVCLGLTIPMLRSSSRANRQWRSDEDREQLKYIREHAAKQGG